MQFPHELMDDVLSRTECSSVFTYPGSPPRHLYDAVRKAEGVELVQVVREQHLLHAAQAHHFRTLETGDEEIPVVIVSGEMGEAMMSQPLLAGSISSPCLVIVAESIFPHVGSANSINHQSARGLTHRELSEYRGAMSRHDGIVDRVMIGDDTDISPVRELIEDIRKERGVGIIHLPEYAYNPNPELDAALDHTAILLNEEETARRWERAERPLILAGGGAKHPEDREQIEQIADGAGAPIVVTMAMEGYFEENYAGRIGVIGDEAANRAVEEADFVLALGTPLNDLHTSMDASNIRIFQRKTVQVNTNHQHFSPFAFAHVPATVEDVLAELEPKEGKCWFKGWEDENQARDAIPDSVLELGDLFREEFDDRVINFGVGNSSLWLPYAIGPNVRKEISRSGSMGEAVSALFREKNPILVLGDGEFEMNLSLVTEAQYNAPSATIFVVNNRRLGLVTERQERQFGSILTPKEDPIDYERFADGFKGVESFTVSSPEDVKEVARTALNSGRVSVVEVEVEEWLAADVCSFSRLPGVDE